MKCGISVKMKRRLTHELVMLKYIKIIENLNEDHKLNFQHITESQTTGRGNKYLKGEIDNIVDQKKPKVH